MTSPIEDAPARPPAPALSSRTHRIVMRTGYAVNGVLHVLIGVLALLVPLIALLTENVERVGALRAVAGNPGGGWAVRALRRPGLPLPAGGDACARRADASSASSANTCTVLPSPMSSARQPPSPSSRRKNSQPRPSLW